MPRPGMVATAVEWLRQLGIIQPDTPQRRLRAERTSPVKATAEPAPKPTSELPSDSATSDDAQPAAPAPAPAVEHQVPAADTTPDATSAALVVATTRAASVEPEPVAASVAKTPGKSFLKHLRDILLWLRDSGLAAIGYLGVLVVCAYGWKTSFIGLHTFAMDHMGLTDSDAWGVPITFDGGAGVLTLVVARAAMNGRGAGVWRLGVLALTLLSSWINWVHIDDYDGRRIAALLPIVSVGSFEGLLSEARKAHEKRTGNVRPRLSLLRWVFDFTGTKNILRAYVLGIPLPDQMLAAAETVAAEKEVAKPRSKHQRRRTRKAKPEPDRPAKAKPEPETPDTTKDAEVIDLSTPGRPDWLTDSMVAKDALWGYLDRNGPPAGQGAGARLTRWLKACGYEVNDDYGRNMLGRWKRETGHMDQPAASGEG